MTKKETELFDGLVTLVKQSMEVQKEILITLQIVNSPPVYNVPAGEAIPETRPGEVTYINKDLPPAADEPPTPAPVVEKPVIPEPKKYTIEDCRYILGQLMEKLGEEKAWAYLKTFKVEMLPDLSPTQYAKLVEGAEALLA